MSAATGGYGRMQSLELLSASRYVDIKDRGAAVEPVRRELQVVVDGESTSFLQPRRIAAIQSAELADCFDVIVRARTGGSLTAIPTQIHPDERTAYLDAILDDLEDREDAPWTLWPEDVHVLALTAVRFLGRNPLGSTTLLTPNHLNTILLHTSLPLPAPASPFSQPSPLPASPPAIEALKIMANLLVLHPTARDAFNRVGGGKALALALAGRDDQGMMIEGDISALDGPERLFLLARLAFLVTVDRPEVVRAMVDTGLAVDSVCYHLTRLAPVVINHAAFAEVLKLVMNIIRYYPSKARVTGETSEDWCEKFDSLLQPLLVLVHSIPNPSLTPPLSTTLHTLLSIPFLPRLLSVWHAVPEPPSPASSTSSVRSLINKISHLGSAAAATANRRSSMIYRSTSNSSAPDETGLGLSGHGLGHQAQHQRVRTLSNKSSTHSVTAATKGRRTKVVATVPEPSAFPIKLLRVLDGWFDAYMPYPEKPDDVSSKVMVDEVLPPVLLLMARAAEGSGEFRKVFKEQLLPPNLDRSTTAGPLEKRRGTLGNILRLMHSSNHFATRDSAGEFLWSVCDGDATTMTAEIGYGNAAGFLFQKGITAPPPGKIQDIPETTTPPLDTSTSSPSSSPDKVPRHPISSLSEPLPTSSDVPMTPDEKLREAERLYVLFERMEKNPVIRLTSEDPANPGQSKGMNELMRDKLASGEMEEREAREEAEERKKQEDEDKKDEEEVKRDMRAYRIRMKKLNRALAAEQQQQEEPRGEEKQEDDEIPTAA